MDRIKKEKRREKWSEVKTGGEGGVKKRRIRVCWRTGEAGKRRVRVEE